MMAKPLQSQLPRLSSLLPGTLTRAEDPEISGVTLDSRAVEPGYLFLACRGQGGHGLSYASEAIERGAAAIAWEPGEIEVVNLPVPTQPVNDLADHAGEIAAAFYGFPSEQMHVVGITGTNGKTSVAHYIAQSLDQQPQRAALIGTLGVGLYGETSVSVNTTPDAVTNQRLLADFLDRGATSVAMEVSSHALDQGRVNGIEFDTAIFTNLTHDHLDYHGTMARYAEAKRRLFSVPGLKHAVINVDDPVGLEMLQRLPSSVRPIACSLVAPQEDVPSIWATQTEAGRQGMAFTLNTPWGAARVESRLIGRFNVSNLLLAAAALLVNDMPLSAVVGRLEQVVAVPGRMEAWGGGHRPLVIVDYAHTPDALRNALAAARENAKQRLICVFGCGGDRDREKRPEMGRIAETLADITIITNDNPRNEAAAQIISDIKAGMARPELSNVIGDREKAVRYALALAGEGDVVLVAGKGHENYQIIGNQRFSYSDRDLVAHWMGAEK